MPLNDGIVVMNNTLQVREDILVFGERYFYPKMHIARKLNFQVDSGTEFVYRVRRLQLGAYSFQYGHYVFVADTLDFPAFYLSRLGVDPQLFQVFNHIGDFIRYSRRFVDAIQHKIETDAFRKIASSIIVSIPEIAVKFAGLDFRPQPKGLPDILPNP
jgi:hypothetical protein